MRLKCGMLKVGIVLQALAFCQALHNTSTSVQRDIVVPEETNKATNQSRLSNTCSGTLEFLHRQTWMPVALDPEYSFAVATQICKDLGCGEARRSVQSSTPPNSSCLTDCVYSGFHLENCTEAPQSDCPNATQVFCSKGLIRLMDGPDPCAGRVELYDAGSWGTVCDDEWDLRDANVVCAQLDCGHALNVTGEGGVFEWGGGPIFLDNVRCAGVEKYLWDCPAMRNSGDCGHKEDAGVLCSGSPTALSPPGNATAEPTVTWTSPGLKTDISPKADHNEARVGCIALSLILLMVPVLNVAFCCYYRRKKAFPVLQGNAQPHVTTECLGEHPEGGDLVSVSTNPAPHADPARTQDSTRNSSSDSDFEQYDFSANPADAMAAFKNSICDRAENKSPLVNTAVLFSLPEVGRGITGHPSPKGNSTAGRSFVHRQEHEDSSSTSSGESYINYNIGCIASVNPSVDSFESSSTSSGECYENTGAAIEELLRTGDSFSTDGGVLPQHRQGGRSSPIYDPAPSSSSPSDDDYDQVTESS